MCRSPKFCVDTKFRGTTHTLGNFTTPIGQVKSPLFYRSSRSGHIESINPHTPRGTQIHHVHDIFIFIHYNINNKQHNNNIRMPNQTTRQLCSNVVVYDHQDTSNEFSCLLKVFFYLLGSKETKEGRKEGRNEGRKMIERREPTNEVLEIFCRRNRRKHTACCRPLLLTPLQMQHASLILRMR